MKVPTEILLDSLCCLDRASLDAVQISTKRLRIAVNKLSDVCLRFLKSASIGAAYEGKKMLPHSYAIRATPEDRKLGKESVMTEEDAGECFANLIASSFSEDILIDWKMHLTDRILLQLQVDTLFSTSHSLIPPGPRPSHTLMPSSLGGPPTRCTNFSRNYQILVHELSKNPRRKFREPWEHSSPSAQERKK